MNRRQKLWWKRKHNTDLAELMKDKELQMLLDSEVKGNTAHKAKGKK